MAAPVIFHEHPTEAQRRARRIEADGTKGIVDGPFAETKELVAGFWILRVRSLEEALEWVKRCPNPMPGEVGEIEIRKIFEPEDFGAALTPELRANEENLREKVEAQKRP